MSTLEEDLAINKAKLEAVEKEIERIEIELHKLPIVNQWRAMLRQRSKLMNEIYGFENDFENYTLQLTAPYFDRHWSDDPQMWAGEDEVNV